MQDWPRDAASAIARQQALRGQVRIEPCLEPISLIAGVDASFDPVTEQGFAVIVLMRIDELKPLTVVRAELPMTFPYIPGLLSFREIPVLLAAFDKLPQCPDLLMVDGQGIAHPRRLGIASHLGVLMNLPAIGVAKSKLVGHFKTLNEKAGAMSALNDKGEHIGTVLRSKAGCLPLFISPGHRIDHAQSVAIVQQCLRGYRLPEPTRIADKLSKRVEREREATLL